jgi:hypothetical protein
MPTKIRTGAAAVLLTLAAAPQLASAQAMFPNFPAEQKIMRSPLNEVRADVRGAASKATHHRAYIQNDVRTSVTRNGTHEGGPYTPSMPVPRGQNYDFQDGPR